MGSRIWLRFDRGSHLRGSNGGLSREPRRDHERRCAAIGGRVEGDHDLPRTGEAQGRRARDRRREHGRRSATATTPVGPTAATSTAAAPPAPDRAPAAATADAATTAATPTPAPLPPLHRPSP